MLNIWIELALFVAILSSGVMAGIYFAFSAFIMSALNALPDDNAVYSMNSINRVILRSTFMPLFFGSSVLALVLIIAGVGKLVSGWAISAGLIYLLGMLGCTVAFNVPLNNRLQAVTSDHQSRVWRHYRIHWTRWNHLRMVSCILACGLYLIELNG